MRSTRLPLGPGLFGRLLALAMAVLLYLAMLAFALAAGADRRLTAAAQAPLRVTLEPVLSGDAGRARAELALIVLQLRAMPDLLGLAVEDSGGELTVEPWLTAGDPPRTRLTASFTPAAAGEVATRLAALTASLPPARLQQAADSADGALAWAQELRLAGLALGALLMLAMAAVAGATAWLICRHCRSTVEVLIGLGAGVIRVTRAIEGVAVRLTLEAALGAAAAILASLLLVRRLPALEAQLPLARLGAAELVLLATIPLLAALQGGLCARLVTSRQLRAYA